MSDLQVTLDAIDQVTGCQHCGGPLGPSPSDDFCCEAHQAAWHAARVDRPKPEPGPAGLPYMSPSREDGAVAEVWAAAPDRESMRRVPDFFPIFPRRLGRTR